MSCHVHISMYLMMQQYSCAIHTVLFPHLILRGRTDDVLLLELPEATLLSSSGREGPARLSHREDGGHNAQVFAAVRLHLHVVPNLKKKKRAKRAKNIQHIRM